MGTPSARVEGAPGSLNRDAPDRLGDGTPRTQATQIPQFGTFTLDHKGNPVFQLSTDFCKRAGCRDALRPDAPGTSACPSACCVLRAARLARTGPAVRLVPRCGAA